ncbi:putative metalloprotease CJM1_0395 family protein [Candidatus Magnetomonas plexicatena]|uniref:putative metalloprotease CJM1_0395 family protein n=1 Tax=Candidatus Magnetomonas plexicatena TaxID=2552947 RepID=UPI001104B9C7|nr:hypothetical protein E2O03_005275 [Nitrospirales bacterium LBB_01]
MGVDGVGYTSYGALRYSTVRGLEDPGSGTSTSSNTKDSTTGTDSSSQFANTQGQSNGEVKDKVTIGGSKGAQSKEQQAQTDREVQKLKQRDQDVRAHELAHQSVGGRYAGAPHYEYQTGPDGKKYAVGGEVSIDTSSEKDPEATVQKMRQVRASALAPADPSAQDMKVASEASQKEAAAQGEVAKEKSGSSGKTADGSGQNKSADGANKSDKDSTQTQGNVTLPGENTGAENSKRANESTQPNKNAANNVSANTAVTAYTQHTSGIQRSSKISVYA